jgi:hypothetical protein
MVINLVMPIMFPNFLTLFSIMRQKIFFMFLFFNKKKTFFKYDFPLDPITNLFYYAHSLK